MKRVLQSILIFLIASSSIEANSILADSLIISRIDSLNNLSYTFRRTNPRLSLEYAVHAYNLSKSIDYPKGNASAIHNRGIAKAVLGKFDTGLSDLMEASVIRESIKDLNGLSSTYNAIGFVFAEMGNDKKALEFYEKALEIRNETGYKTNLGILLNNIGWIYFREGKLDKALENFYKALAVNQEDNDDRGVGASQSNIGNVYRRIGNFNKGLEYHFKALETGQKFDDKYGTVNTLRYIAEDYLDLGDVEKATNYALKSLILAQEIESVSEEKNSAVLLAKIYEIRNKFPEATSYLKMANRLKDSLFSIEKAEVLGHLQTVFELEAKEKENEMLRIEQSASTQKIKMQSYFLLLSIGFIVLILGLATIIFLFNRKLKDANLKLSQLNNEITSQKEDIEQKANSINEKKTELEATNQIKDKLISVIAHDLKNPLNSVSGYSEIIISRFDSYTKDEIISFLRIIHDNAMRSNMLLDNLLQWSRLQTRTITFIPTEQKLYKLVTDEIYFVVNTAAEKKVTIKTKIHEDLYLTADSNMIKTIVRNLISNAVKFSRKGGEVIVSAEASNGETIISVEDNGVGIPHHVKEKLFTGEAGVTTSGTAGEKGTGLGLMLCKDFVEAHDGKIWVESEPDKGSRFSISIPHKLNDEE